MNLVFVFHCLITFSVNAEFAPLKCLFASQTLLNIFVLSKLSPFFSFWRPSLWKIKKKIITLKFFRTFTEISRFYQSHRMICGWYFTHQDTSTCCQTDAHSYIYNIQCLSHTICVPCRNRYILYAILHKTRQNMQYFRHDLYMYFVCHNFNFICICTCTCTISTQTHRLRLLVVGSGLASRRHCLSRGYISFRNLAATIYISIYRTMDNWYR